MSNTSGKFNINFNKLSELEKEQAKKEQDRIFLTYKLIKNLYLCFDIEKKQTIMNKFSEMCIDSGEKMEEFFNQLFDYLNEKYDIKKNENNDSIKSDENCDLYNDDDEDDDYEEKEVKKNANEKELETPQEKKEENIVDKETMKKLKHIELIKSICVRFKDEMCLGSIKSTKDNSRNSILKTSFLGRATSAGNFFYKGNCYSTYNLNRNTNKEKFYLNANRYSAEKLDSQTDLTKDFESFNDFTISPYTFNSFFLVIFRNWSSRSKLNFIKAINEENYKRFKLIIDKTKYMDNLEFIQLINQMIQRVGKEENDTFFMNKIDFFEYVYNIFIKFIFDMIEMYENCTNENKNEIKNIPNILFCKHEYVIQFYITLFNSLKTQKERLGNVEIINSRVKKTNTADNKESEKKLDNILKKMESDMKSIIDKTLYNYVDIFYFKLLFQIYIKDYKNNAIYDFVFKIIQHIIEKLEEYEELHPFLLKKDKNEEYSNSHIKVGINNKNLLLLIYQMTFFNPRKKYLIENEIFEKNIVLYLTNFLQKKQLV